MEKTDGMEGWTKGFGSLLVALFPKKRRRVYACFRCLRPPPVVYFRCGKEAAEELTTAKNFTAAERRNIMKKQNTNTAKANTNTATATAEALREKRAAALDNGGSRGGRLTAEAAEAIRKNNAEVKTADAEAKARRAAEERKQRAVNTEAAEAAARPTRTATAEERAAAAAKTARENALRETAAEAANMSERERAAFVALDYFTPLAAAALVVKSVVKCAYDNANAANMRKQTKHAEAYRAAATEADKRAALDAAALDAEKDVRKNGGAGKENALVKLRRAADALNVAEAVAAWAALSNADAALHGGALDTAEARKEARETWTAAAARYNNAVRAMWDAAALDGNGVALDMFGNAVAAALEAFDGAEVMTAADFFNKENGVKAAIAKAANASLYAARKEYVKCGVSFDALQAAVAAAEKEAEAAAEAAEAAAENGAEAAAAETRKNVTAEAAENAAEAAEAAEAVARVAALLTPTQKRYMAYMLRGLSQKQTAQKMRVRLETVYNYAEAVRKAWRAVRGENSNAVKRAEAVYTFAAAKRNAKAEADAAKRETAAAALAARYGITEAEAAEIIERKTRKAEELKTAEAIERYALRKYNA